MIDGNSTLKSIIIRHPTNDITKIDSILKSIEFNENLLNFEITPDNLEVESQLKLNNVLPKNREISDRLEHFPMMKDVKMKDITFQ